MSDSIPPALLDQLRKDHEEIVQYLMKNEFDIQDIPLERKAIREEGESFSLAYPIQGILKYHGFVGDPKNRIAYFPSISFNNTCASTVSYLKFDKKFKKDSAYINGEQVFGEKSKRIEFALDFIRDYSNFNTKATLISRNIINYDTISEIGKGLGTSASGSAALALAASSIIYDNNPDYIKNERLMSIFSRYLSGSGCRSATGGFSLWLSHPKIQSMNCYALRLNKKQHESFIEDISLLTIPIQSELKTTQAHEIAQKSPFFYSWLKQRKDKIINFIDALNNHDFDKIGELAEFDTLCLHSIAMTAPNNENIIAWKPETLEIMLKIRELRKEGYRAYYSIDTGPSVVILTQTNEKREIKEKIQSINSSFNIIEGKIGGPSKLLDMKTREVQLLEKDIQEFLE